MKKMMMIAALAVATAGIAGDFEWNWWVKPEPERTSLDGCSLGIAAGHKSVTGAQVNLLWGKVGDFFGGCQFSFGYSRADTLRNGCQLAFVNSADLAALQFGLICVNKDGFLPVFPFFNFSKRGFGGRDRK